jgi:1,4-dihydroxy-2-naphthoyl-CoA hydrolase
MFEYRTTVWLHDTDASGRLYFASLLRIAHEAFEAMLGSVGYPVGDILASAELDLPIVHADVDFHSALRAGDTLHVEVHVSRLGETSLTTSFRFTAGGDRDAGAASMVHVALDKATGAKRSLPGDLREALAAHT